MCDLPIEEGWISIPLGGVPMERINLPFFYQLGTELRPVTELKVTEKNRIQSFITCLRAQNRIQSLFGSYSTLTVCRASGGELLHNIGNIDDWVKKTPSEEWRKEDQNIDYVFQQVISKAKEFEIVLSAELQTLATYHVTQKGIYSTTSLIEKAEMSLPESILNKIDSAIVEEIRQSGRCLAFDVATASAFHMMRATESVIHKYYLQVCKPQSKKKLGSWGAYITNLSQSQNPQVKEVIALLQQIKDRHHNLIMHPEIVLTPDEAFTLFEIAQSAIITMAGSLPIVEKKVKSTQATA